MFIKDVEIKERIRRKQYSEHSLYYYTLVFHPIHVD